jgi:hypothetical protein
LQAYPFQSAGRSQAVKNGCKDERSHAHISGSSADEKQSFQAASILGILARDRKQAQAK